MGILFINDVIFIITEGQTMVTMDVFSTNGYLEVTSWVQDGMVWVMGEEPVM